VLTQEKKENCMNLMANETLIRTPVAYLEPIAKVMSNYVNGASRGLDFGSGDGHFCMNMSWMLNMPFDGIEANPELLAKAQANVSKNCRFFGADFSRPIQVPDLSEYDVAYNFCDTNPEKRKEAIELVIQRLLESRKRPVLVALSGTNADIGIEASRSYRVGKHMLNVYKF